MMTRRLVHLLTALSLLACVGVVALWVDSYFGRHRLYGHHRIGTHEIVVEAQVYSGGVISLECTHWSGANLWSEPYGWRYFRRPPWQHGLTEVNRLGFGL